MKKTFIKNTVSLLVLGALCLPMAVSARLIDDVQEENAEYNRRSSQYAEQRNEIVRGILGDAYKENNAERTRLTSHLTEAVHRIVTDRDAQLNAIDLERGPLSERRAVLLNTGAFIEEGADEYDTINARLEELERAKTSLIQAAIEQLIPLNDKINTLSADVNAQQRELDARYAHSANDITESQILGEVALLSRSEAEEAGRS